MVRGVEGIGLVVRYIQICFYYYYYCNSNVKRKLIKLIKEFGEGNDSLVVQYDFHTVITEFLCRYDVIEILEKKI